MAIVLVAAAALRVWGLSFGLPFTYHPDEPTKVATAIRILQTRDLNPHYFLKPSLQIYLTSAAHAVCLTAQKWLGSGPGIDGVSRPAVIAPGVGITASPETFLIARALSAAAGCGAVLVLFFLGWRLTGDPWVGALAAAMLAVSPAHVGFSHIVHPDALMIFLLLVAAWASLGIVRRTRTRDYVFAGLAVGVAAGAKYNAAFALLIPVAAHYALDPEKQVIRDSRLALCFVMAGVGFLLTTPYAVIDWGSFLGSFLFETVHDVIGHPGHEGGAPGWYLRYLLAFEGPVAVIAAVQVGRVMRRRWRARATPQPDAARSMDFLFLAVFPLVYFAVIACLQVRNEQTLLPVLPFVFLFAAVAVVDALRWAAGRGPATLRSPVVTVAVVAALLCLPATRSIAADRRLGAIDSRETARRWIDENMPVGSRVALESYSTYVDPARFSVRGEWLLCAQTPEWYVQEGVEYLVFGEKAFGRFYADPGRYARQIEDYERLFQAFEPVKTFNDGGYEVRIYRVPVPREDRPRRGTNTVSWD